MTGLLISLIRSKIAAFRFTKRLIDTRAPDRCGNAERGKMRSDRIDHRSLLTGEEMARSWFTRANSLPMPIDIGLGTEMGVAMNITETALSGAMLWAWKLPTMRTVATEDIERTE
jgi:hypothetical protein